MSSLHSLLVAVVACVLCLTAPTWADEYTHRYKMGERVHVYGNKCGPYYNPQETFPIFPAAHDIHQDPNDFMFPVCRQNPDTPLEYKFGGLGEVLLGNQLVESNWEVYFRVPTNRTVCCTLDFSGNVVEAATMHVRENFYFELIVDDLPVWAFFGQPEWSLGGTMKRDEQHDFYFAHRKLIMKYHDDRIVEVDIESSHHADVQDQFYYDGEDDQSMRVHNLHEMSYSVEWVYSDEPFTRRYERYLDQNFFEHQIHWYSIFNSFMMVLFLTGLVSMILMRTLKHDYTRYSREDDDLESLERDVSEETGWKLVHGDVFRPPVRLELLCCVVGSGLQLFVAGALLILLSMFGTLWMGRGTIVTVGIVLWSLTSVLNGYVSGALYSRSEGKRWMQCMYVTCLLFPGIVFIIAFCVNLVAWVSDSLAAIPFGTVVLVILIWGLVSCPLIVAGTVVGRNWSGTPDNPCRVKRIPTPIPDRRWHLKCVLLAMLGGLLPFGSIFIEMYFIFTSFWSYKVYYVYGFMFVVFLILTIVTNCVSIVATYFMLNAENYHWHWTSFGGGASIGLYIMGYSTYFFRYKTKMKGVLQISFYFGYSSMLCVAMGLMCGALSYVGSSIFVRRIFRNIKTD